MVVKRSRRGGAESLCRVLVLGVLAAGCGGHAAPDAGREDGAMLDAEMHCAVHAECDDGLYCNGEERCRAGRCESSEPPCQACDEAADRCDCTVADEDDDGHDAIACGGDDCDDADPAVYPGAVEICDAEGRDEDCDPSTLGPDGDADGYIATACCNGELCGDDCDDETFDINPGATDSCGGGDQDCDGAVDEEPDRVIYLDRDADTYGDPSTARPACAFPADGMSYSARGDDCEDDPFENALAAQVNPGAAETCDGIDNNCNGTVDDRVDSAGEPRACSCATPGLERSCGLVDPTRDGVGVCRLGRQVCADGGWSPCVGAVAPSDEMCDAGGLDEDCDGDSEEGPPINAEAYYRDEDMDGFGDPSTEQRRCPGEVDGWVDNPDDCDDGRASVRPTATERPGDSLDSNCDGDELCFVDDDGDGARTEATRVSSDARCRGATVALASAPIDCDDDDARRHPEAGFSADGICPPGRELRTCEVLPEPQQRCFSNLRPQICPESCAVNAGTRAIGGCPGGSLECRCSAPAQRCIRGSSCTGCRSTDGTSPTHGVLGARCFAGYTLCSCSEGEVQSCEPRDGICRLRAGAETPPSDFDFNCDGVEQPGPGTAGYICRDELAGPGTPIRVCRRSCGRLACECPSAIYEGPRGSAECGEGTFRELSCRFVRDRPDNACVCTGPQRASSGLGCR